MEQVKSLLLLQLLSVCVALQSVPQQPRTCDELYIDGILSYGEENWPDTVAFFRQAIENYNQAVKAREQCYTECSGQAVSVPRDYTDDGELRFFHGVLQRSACVQQCKEHVAGLRALGGVSSKVEKNMANRMPYNYLQLALYKKSDLLAAASAAATYHHFNPTDELASGNMEFYQSQSAVTKDHLQPLESGLQYQHLYLEAEQLYKEEKYAEMVEKLEESLKALLPVVQKCRTLCNGPLQYTKNHEFAEAMSQQFMAVLDCRTSCLQKLGQFRDEPDKNFLASYFDYLQYGYHWIRELKEAVKAVATHRRIEPRSEVARMNAVYLQQLPGISKKDHVVRQDVLPLVEQLEEEQQLLQILRNITGHEGREKATPEEEENDQALLQKDFHNHPVGPTTPSSNDDKKEEEEEKKKKEEKNEEEKKEEEEVERMVMDKMVSEAECKMLMDLASLGKEGDGYQRKSPHTPYEKFEGLTILDAAKAAIKKQTSEAAVQLYMNASTMVKDAVAARFKLQRPLYFSFTHLVCRTAREEVSEQRSDLSHPVHSDNCILDEAGECNKVPPAYTWRDYSAILYLNNDFEGGKFFFAHSTKDLSPKEFVDPRCGRMVGFSAGKENMHGVTAVTQGRRCAVALWFTLDPSHREDAYTEAELLMKSALSS